MKRIVAMMAMLMSLTAWAYDFSAVASSGQTLYYNIVEGGVEVVYPGSSAVNPWSGYTAPTGALTIPSTVTHGGVDYDVLWVAIRAFYGCAITSLVVEQGVESLENSCFSNCASLTTVTLPLSLNNVGSQAFGNCTSLTDVWMNAIEPPTTASGAFYNSPVASATLHLPCQSYDAYAAVAPWNSFGTLDAATCTATIAVGVNSMARGTVSGGGVYEVGTYMMLSALPAEGYAFICWNDGDTLNPRIVHVEGDSSFTAMFFAMIHDTVVEYHTDYVHDTTLIMDTVFIPVVVTDTVWIYDTLVVYDTVNMTDTVYPTFYRLQVFSSNEAQGLGVGSALLPAGTEVEICGLPMQGYRFVSWSDGNVENPRRVTLTGGMDFTAEFTRLSAESVSPSEWNLATDGRRVSVSCAEGSSIEVYDVGGRLLTAMRAGRATTHLMMPAAGVYVVRVNDSGARKVVVE